MVLVPSQLDPMVTISNAPVGYTVQPLNKGHFGDNINSAVLSFVERLSSSRKFNKTM